MIVGIVGGLGPESTVDYYRRIIELWQQDDPSSAGALAPGAAAATWLAFTLEDAPGAPALAHGDVACVLAEPALTNIGIVLPDDGYLAGAKFDEAATKFGLTPASVVGQPCSSSGTSPSHGRSGDAKRREAPGRLPASRGSADPGHHRSPGGRRRA